MPSLPGSKDGSHSSSERADGEVLEHGHASVVPGGERVHQLGGSPIHPLVTLYNNQAIVMNYRQQVKDLMIKGKYLKGKLNPCDYSSRQPTVITDLTAADKEKLGMDDSDEVTVMKVYVDDMPVEEMWPLLGQTSRPIALE